MAVIPWDVKIWLLSELSDWTGVQKNSADNRNILCNMTIKQKCVKSIVWCYNWAVLIFKNFMLMLMFKIIIKIWVSQSVQLKNILCNIGQKYILYYILLYFMYCTVADCFFFHQHELGVLSSIPGRHWRSKLASLLCTFNSSEKLGWVHEMNTHE